MRKLSRAGCKSGLVSRRPSSRAAMSLVLPGEDKWPLYKSMILVTRGGQDPELQQTAVSATCAFAISFPSVVIAAEGT